MDDASLLLCVLNQLGASIVSNAVTGGNFGVLEFLVVECRAVVETAAAVRNGCVVLSLVVPHSVPFAVSISNAVLAQCVCL